MSKDPRKKYDIQSQADNVIARDDIFTDVLRDFSEHQKKKDSQQRIQKAIFFWIVCIVFLSVVIGCLIAIVAVASKEEIGWKDFSVALTSVVSLISVILILPSKIAEHLFPANGEKDITDFIIRMHQVDIGVYKEGVIINASSEPNDDEDFLAFQQALNGDDE